MPQVDVQRLIWIVAGIQLNAELGDRPLAYRLEQEVKRRLTTRLGAPEPGQPPALAAVVISDVYFMNFDEAHGRPFISVGGPGVNALSAQLVDQLPTPVAIEDTLVIQMDLELNDLRCAVWGINHLETVRAVDLFIARGYLDQFLDGVISARERED